MENFIETKPTGLSYEGKVTIKLVKDANTVRQVKTHNAGTLSLFRYIGLAIMGEARALEHMPSFIHTYYWDQSRYTDEQMFYESTCAVNVPVSTRDLFLDEDQARVELTFLIPYTQIWGKTNVLALYGTPAYNYATDKVEIMDKEPLAYVHLDDEDIIDVDAESTNILIN